MPPVTRRTIFRSARLTIVVVMISIAITAAAQGLTRAPLDGFAIAIAAGIPMITGFPTAIWVFGIKEQLHRANADLARANALLEQRANFDALTGLRMRASFFDELEQARSKGCPGVLLMIDADHFKSINDGYGHLSGDIVLVGIAEIIRSKLRHADVAGRFGGEEFVVYLPNTDSEAGWAVAESVRTAVESHDFRSIDGLVVNVTVSIGMAKARKDQDRSQLLGDGDRQLYRAKEGGRNRTMSEWSLDAA